MILLDNPALVHRKVCQYWHLCRLKIHWYESFCTILIFCRFYFVDLYHQNYLKTNGTSVDGFFYCPHKPNENCNCRKPKPGLLHQAILELNIDPKSSWMIGDNNSDIDAATSVGCKAIKLSKNFSLGKAVSKILDSRID